MKFSAIDAEDGSPDLTSEVYRIFISDGVRNRQGIFSVDTNGDATFIAFLQFIRNTIGATPGDTLLYYDEEDDLVTCGSDCELQEALRIARLKGNRLKVTIQVKNDGRDSPEAPSIATRRRTISSVEDQSVPITHIDDEGFPADINPTRGTSAPSSLFEVGATGESEDPARQPPEWFITYMENFKEDITATITRKIMTRLQQGFNAPQDQGEQRACGQMHERPNVVGGGARTKEKPCEWAKPTALDASENYGSPMDLACSVDCAGLAKSFEKLQIATSTPQGDGNKKKMNAKFLLDETYPDGSKLPPGHRFTKGWWMRNCGEEAWDSNTKLSCSWKASEFVFEEDLAMSVPCLKSGEEGLVTMEHVSPCKVGKYESYWRLAHDGVPFGDRIWCSIVVYDPNDGEEMNFAVAEDVVLVQEPASGENERMMARADDGAIPRYTSQTATPNNTPLVGSPLKSPDTKYPEPVENLDQVAVISCNDKTDTEATKSQETDCDGSSVVSLSGSVSSDTDFVVVPLPSCFNVDIPLEMNQDDDNNNMSRRLDDKSTSSRSSVELLGFEENPLELQPEWSHYGDHSYAVKVGDEGEKDLLASSPQGPCGDIPGADSERGSNDGESSSPDSNNNSDYAAALPLLEVHFSEISVDGNEEPNRDICQQPDLLCYTPPYPVVTQPALSPVPTSEVHPPPQRPQPIPRTTVIPPEGSSASSRIVHILPEGLLSATASVFNSAKTAFSALQWVPVSSAESYSPDEDWNNISQPRSASRLNLTRDPPEADPASADDPGRLLGQLLDMGFCNRERNAFLLEKHNNDVDKVVEELLAHDDHNWFTHRH